MRNLSLKQLMEATMEEEQIREALDAHWHASAIGDANAEHDIYDDDAICDYPQSGERILGRRHLQALRSHHPDKPSGRSLRGAGLPEAMGSADRLMSGFTGEQMRTNSIPRFCRCRRNKPGSRRVYFYPLHPSEIRRSHFCPCRYLL